MYRIMQTIWLNEVQSRGVRTRYQETQKPSEELSENGEALAGSRLALKEVERVMLGLPEQDRAVLLMVCVDGLTYKETAEVLNIPIGTVMSRLARARLKLVEHLSAGTPSFGNIVRLTSHDHDR
jgi:RNA polymerase sigma-70 factor, ECF subfamily